MNKEQTQNCINNGIAMEKAWNAVMGKKQLQQKFEAITFMHQRPQEQQDDYMDVYAEPPRSK